MNTKDKKRSARPAGPAAKQNARNRAGAEIVYTQPMPFNRNRFLLRLATVVAVVLALVFGMSIFFKVKNVTVAGAEKYTAWDIKEASGIQEGENLLTLNRAKIGGKIRTQLPYVKGVRIGIKLPDTVNIEIVEMDLVYAVEGSDSSWWLMDAAGKLVEKISASAAKGYTQVLGVKLESPAIGNLAVAAEPEPEQTDESGQTVPVTVQGSERLSAVITILQYLEENGVIGQAASLDVTNMLGIEMWYEDRYRVLLGDTTQLGYKIQTMKKAIDQQKDYQTGILDVSFTTWPDQVNLRPFSE